jgi:hypothetical protein
MSTASHDRERLLDLLADEAAGGLDYPERGELESLLERHGDVPRDELMRTAALVQVSCARRAGISPMPADLKARIAARAGNAPGGAAAGPEGRTGTVADLSAARTRRRSPAPGASAGAPPGPDTGLASPRRGLNLPAVTGWAAAAALAVALILARQPGAPVPDALTDPRAALLAEADDVVLLPWNPPSAPGFENVRGDVVWSDSRQQGYLRLAGMPVNDPARSQYQLWIVDPDRDTHPVDGGVFDVSSTGEVLIPFQARLAVDDPTAFAITEEQPGGVVVSAGPLLVVATTG